MKSSRKWIHSINSYIFIAVFAVYLVFGSSSLEEVQAATSTVSYNSKDYTTESGSDMAYRKDSKTFDFIGNYKGTWKRVSYATQGYSTIMTVDGVKTEDIVIDGSQAYNGVSVNVQFNFAKDGSLQVSYVITNTTGSSKVVSIGSHADVQIGNDDKAPITPFSNKTDDGKIKGFMMNESSTGAQFNFYARGYAGVTAVDSVWYGNYSERKTNIYSDMGAGNNLTDIDSGMAWAWQNRTIPANTTQKFNVKFIIAEKGSENNVAASGTISLIKIGDIQHSFDVYQLMEGTVDPDNTYASVLNWGSSIQSYTKKNGSSVTATRGATVPIDVMQEIVESQSNNDKTELIGRFTLGTPVKSGTSVNGSIAFPNLTCGYYLIRDTTILSGDSTDIVSRDLLIYLDDEGCAVEIKRAKPSFNKYVNTNGADENAWAEAAGYTMGEEFRFKLTATLPANEDFAGYGTYKMVFHDEYSDGIAFNKIESVNYVIDGQTYEIPQGKYHMEPAEKGFTLTIDDFAEIAGADWGSPTKSIDVNVIYSANLNKSAPSINESTSDASYNVNQKVSSGNAYLEYPNNPSDSDQLGTTEKDYVGVFTYKLINTKYANFVQTGYELNNAKFVLYKDSKTPENIVKLIYDETIHSYRPIESGETPVEYMETGYGINEEEYKGKMDISGIGAGTYILVETEAPEEYNEIDDYKFTFSVTTEENANGTGGVATIVVQNGEGNTDDSDNKGDTLIASLVNDIVDTLVSNKTLPETGGVGTKFMYLAGSIMIIGSGVILIIRKRLLTEM